MNFTISKENIGQHNDTNTSEFPKYTSQLINWANQNAQGTRPNIVGQLSEVFPKYIEEASSPSIIDWEKWYTEHYPNALTTAANRICIQMNNLKEAIKLIDQAMIEAWVKELVINKTYNGMFVQKAILAELARLKGQTYRMANPKEESKGIDGFVGDTAYSIKPDTYKTMDRLPEVIDAAVIYYSKTTAGISVELKD